MLAKNPHSKWFAKPVDLVESELGIQDYYDKVKTPMDLQTVKQKLESGMYSHPFRWQHDIRTIFYNAFHYYKPTDPVWRGAAELAMTFENLCKEMIEVNPYAVFVRPSPQPVAVPIVAVPSNTAPAPVTQAAAAGGEAVAAPVAVPVLAPPTAPPRKKSSATSPAHPVGVKVREPNGVVTYSADCIGTPLARYYESHLPVSALPPPVCVGGIESSSRTPLLGISNSQKKNLPARFRELDVFYRKSLLEWVKDELGIHPLLCALDVRYVPDLDLLPPVKAKQFFVYMKALMTQQKQAQEEKFLPTTLPQVLNWDVASPQAAEQSPPSATAAPVPNSSSLVVPAQRTAASWTVTQRRDRETSSSSVAASSSSSSESEDDEDDASDVHGNTPQWKQPWAGGLGKQRTVGTLGLWRQNVHHFPAAQPPAGGASCWSEWKTKLMQHEFTLKSKANDVTAASEMEAKAERADAEI